MTNNFQYEVMKKLIQDKFNNMKVWTLYRYNSKYNKETKYGRYTEFGDIKIFEKFYKGNENNIKYTNKVDDIEEFKNKNEITKMIEKKQKKVEVIDIIDNIEVDEEGNRVLKMPKIKIKEEDGNTIILGD